MTANVFFKVFIRYTNEKFTLVHKNFSHDKIIGEVKAMVENLIYLYSLVVN